MILFIPRAMTPTKSPADMNPLTISIGTRGSKNYLTQSESVLNGHNSMRLRYKVVAVRIMNIPIKL